MRILNNIGRWWFCYVTEGFCWHLSCIYPIFTPVTNTYSGATPQESTKTGVHFDMSNRDG